jgi:Uma2 family endonuclease
MEVADSTLLDDRRRKGVLYAEARVPEFWLVNLVAGLIEMYTLPRAGKYRRSREFQRDEVVPLFLGGRQVAEFAVKDFVG